MADFIKGIISLTIGAVLMANVFIFTIKNQSHCAGTLTNGSCSGGAWTAAEITMWGLLSLIGVVGLVFGVLSVFGIA